MGIAEVFGYFGLSVDRHGATGQAPEVDPCDPTRECQLNTVVYQPLAVQTLAHTRFVEQINRSLFEESSANSRLDVVTRALFDDDRVHTIAMQQL